MDFNFLRRKNILQQPDPALVGMGNGTPDITQTGEDPNKLGPLDSTANPGVVKPISMGSSTNPNPVGDSSPDISAPPVTAAPQSRLQDVYSQLSTLKPGPAQQKYTDFLASNEPQEGDFKHTKMQRVGAILAGVGEGLGGGAGAGIKAANSVLDDPFNKARDAYKLQSDKLAKGADLEEKDMGRRVSTFNDITKATQASNTEAETKRFHDAQIQNFVDQAKTRGEHTAEATDPTTGMKTLTVTHNDGTKSTFELGKAALTPLEDVGHKVDVAKGVSKATKQDKIDIAGAGIDRRGAVQSKLLDQKFDDIKSLKDYIKANADKKYVGTVNKDGMLVMTNKADPTDSVVTSVDTGKLNDTDKAALGLKNAQALKQTPGPDEEIETDVHGNTRIVKKHQTSPTKEQTKPVPGNDGFEAFSADGGKTWKARKKTK